MNFLYFNQIINIVIINTIMDYDNLKNLMRNYIGDIVDSKELEYLFVNDPDVEYNCSEFTKSKGFTHLHKCVLLTKKYPELNDYLEEYLKIHGNVDEINYKMWSALHLASCNSNTRSMERTVEILINAGANVNLQNEFGYTALHLASRYSGYTSTERTVELLISAGTNVNLQNYWGNTAIHLAFLYLSTKRIVEMLINAGSDVFNLKNREGRTPYDYFSKKLKEYLQIDEETKTIGILTGKSIKPAKK